MLSKTMLNRFLIIVFVLTSIGFPFVAYNSGFDRGAELGHQSGYEDGKEKGYLMGLDEGHSLGMSDGYNEGFMDGHQFGYVEGYDLGYGDGHGVGYAEGYEKVKGLPNVTGGYLITEFATYEAGQINALGPVELYPTLMGTPETPGILWLEWKWHGRSTTTFNIAIWNYDNRTERILPHYNTTAKTVTLTIQADKPIRMIMRFGWEDPTLGEGEMVPLKYSFYIAEWVAVSKIAVPPESPDAEAIVIHIEEDTNE